MGSCGSRRNIWDQDFLGFKLECHGEYREHLECHALGPQRVEAIDALERLLSKTGIRNAVSYRGETTCF